MTSADEGRSTTTPAFYAVGSTGWRAWVTLLHLPYTAWHLSYVVVGGCLTVERASLEALRWLARNRERLLEKRREILSRRTVSDRALLRWFGPDPGGARIPDIDA